MAGCGNETYNANVAIATRIQNFKIIKLRWLFNCLTAAIDEPCLVGNIMYCLATLGKWKRLMASFE